MSTRVFASAGRDGTPPSRRSVISQRVGLLIALVVIWDVQNRLGLIDPQVLPAPGDVLSTFWDLLRVGDTWVDIRVTLGQLVMSMAIAMFLGTAVGLLAWRVRPFRSAVYPWLTAANAVPGLLFYPFAIVIVGLGTPSIVLLASLLGTFTMAELMLAGLREVSTVYLEVARTLRASRIDTLRSVVLPAAFGVVLTAVRVTFTLVFIVTIASQYILSGAGIGYRLRYYYEMFRTEQMYAYLLLIMVLSLTLQFLIARLLGLLRGQGEAVKRGGKSLAGASI
jgi:NitT/TauT family transport system permease protein